MSEKVSPSFMLLLRVYDDGQITGTFVQWLRDITSAPERELDEAEVQLARPIIKVFTDENDLLLNVSRD